MMKRKKDESTREYILRLYNEEKVDKKDLHRLAGVSRQWADLIIKNPIPLTRGRPLGSKASWERTQLPEDDYNFMSDFEVMELSGFRGGQITLGYKMRTLGYEKRYVWVRREEVHSDDKQRDRGRGVATPGEMPDVRENGSADVRKPDDRVGVQRVSSRRRR